MRDINIVPWGVELLKHTLEYSLSRMEEPLEAPLTSTIRYCSAFELTKTETETILEDII
jgi:hypothetical protein